MSEFCTGFMQNVPQTPCMETLARDLAPLKRLPDNHAKKIITMDELTANHDGIETVNILDSMLEQ